MRNEAVTVPRGRETPLLPPPPTPLTPATQDPAGWWLGMCPLSECELAGRVSEERVVGGVVACGVQQNPLAGNIRREEDL